MSEMQSMYIIVKNCKIYVISRHADLLRHNPAKAPLHGVLLDNLMHLHALICLLPVHCGRGVNHAAYTAG